MVFIQRIFIWMSSLKIAIGLLIIIAISSSLGTFIPQGEAKETYISIYNDDHWLGILSGENILQLQLNHIYTSSWFLSLLLWLGVSLMICSFRRQIPSLKAAMKWVDYKDPKQISKLAIAKTLNIEDRQINLINMAKYLEDNGWKVKQSEGRISARKGIIGKFGPPLVHIGLVLLMIGSVWGALLGEHLERFLTPGNSIEFINSQGESELEMILDDFQIDRDPVGRAEQFRSQLKVKSASSKEILSTEISVNHPLRFKGLTLYQADWALSEITLQIDNSKPVKLPLQKFPELGPEIWGLVLPTSLDGSNPILLSASKEEGPIKVFDEDGHPLASLRPGEKTKMINGIPLKVLNIIPSSGLLLKRDPGVPLVYISFAITLIGGGISILATRKFWAISDPNNQSIHIGGLCNRNPSGLANELNSLATKFSKK